MRLTIHLLFLLFAVLLSMQQLQGQEKIEIEKSIAVEKVPKEAVSFIEKHFPDAKTKWIFEQSESDNTYEAKLHFQRKRLSVEFFKNGDFLDAELTIDAKEMDQSTLDSIKTFLSEKYKNFKIQKIQRQYTGEGEDAIKLLKQASLQPNAFAKVNYELIVWGKSKDANAFFEFLFDHSGDFIKMQKLSSINSDNLFY